MTLATGGPMRLASDRRLRHEPRRGRWKLIGVHTGGKAQDLTHLLDVVHDESSGPLAELARHGLAFDSLILSIFSESNPSLEDSPAVSGESSLPFSFIDK